MVEINSQLKHLVKRGDLGAARDMFDSMLSKDEISWTTMISAYVNASDSSEALCLFSKMWAAPGYCRMDPIILSLALKACAQTSDVANGETLHGYCLKTGFVNSVFVASATVDMYMKAGRVSEGCMLFDEMPLRNVVSWTAIITGLVHAGLNSRALVYFRSMWSDDGVEHDSYTFAVALKACADMEFLKNGKEIHSRTIKKGFDATSFVANSLSAMYSKCGKLSYGLRLFEGMRKRDVVSWTSLITTYVQTGRERLGIDSFMTMRSHGILPNEYTFAAVISGIANIGRLDFGRQLHGHVLLAGFGDASSVANSLMTMYSKCGYCDSARVIFLNMAARDVVSWSTLIAGYSQSSSEGGEAVFDLLSWMRREGPRPTEYPVSSVLSFCGSMAILDQGRQLHSYALIVGLDRTPMIRSSLISMYSKCGSIAEAERVFEESDGFNEVVSWTAMINGYADHGRSLEAIRLFEKLRDAGLKPDSVTFVGVLNACSHSGLGELGFGYFDSMMRDYGISPSREHYGCMIDLLCRAGKLREAMGMISSMPWEADPVIWSSVLRGSREKGDVECGRMAAERILEVDPDCAGTHVGLANVYAWTGRWREAAEVRKRLRARGLSKEPGWSWIKIRDELCVFVAGDKRRRRTEEMYFVLSLIA
ncbi:hypothetical protein M569_05536, partial [Genlisea aurea]